MVEQRRCSRIRTLEPVRQYAREESRRREADTVRRRHIRFFVALAEELSRAKWFATATG